MKKKSDDKDTDKGKDKDNDKSKLKKHMIVLILLKPLKKINKRYMVSLQDSMIMLQSQKN